MLKDFLKNSAIYGIGRMGTVVVSFITMPILTHHLTPTDYGVLDLLVLLISLLNVSVALEVSQAIARFFNETDFADRTAYTSTGLFFSLFMYAITCVVILLFREQIAIALFGRTALTHFVVLMVPFFILFALQYFITSQLRWENRPLPQIALQILQAILFLVSILVLVVGHHQGIEGAIYSHLFSLLVVVAIGVVLLVKSGSLALKFSNEKLKTMLRFSLPLVPSSLGVYAQLYVDRIMISQLLSLHDLGIYGFGLRIAGLLTLVIGAFQMSITPLVYEHYKKTQTRAKISQAFRLYLFCVFSLGMGLCLFLPEFFYLFIGKAFYEAASLIPVLLFVVILSQSYVFAPGLLIEKKTSMVAAINLCGMVLNAGLNFWFISHYGVWGAVLATAISALITTNIHFVVSQKYYSIPYNPMRIILSSILILLLTSAILQYQSIQLTSLSLLLCVEKLLVVFCAVIVIALTLFKTTELKAAFLAVKQMIGSSIIVQVRN